MYINPDNCISDIYGQETTCALGRTIRTQASFSLGAMLLWKETDSKLKSGLQNAL